MDVERVFPNPNGGAFVIDLVSQSEGDVTIEMLDLRGKLVWSSDYQNVSGFTRIEVSVPDLAVGMYQLRIRKGSESKMMKIQIAK